MNLTCHEYLMCQDGKASGKKHGPVILSEFTGCASVFDGAALVVNPWDFRNVSEAFKTGLEMGEEEEERRYEKMRKVVMHHTGEIWISDLIRHLAKVHEEQFSRDTMSIPRLSAGELARAYERTGKRLFVLDYEGTLASYVSVNNRDTASLKRVVDMLNNLVSDDKNAVYVMSGRTTQEVESDLDHVRGLGLTAENGCFLRFPGSRDWIQFPNEQKTVQWKEPCKSVLQYYLERVENSYLEERRCSLVFHYGTASESDSFTRHAGDCANHINDACEQQRVKAVPIANSVIIEPIDIDKLTAIRYIWSNYLENACPDFLLVAGNDRSDENVFSWAKELKEDRRVRYVQTVNIGRRNSMATATLTNGATSLINILNKLAKIRTV